MRAAIPRNGLIATAGDDRQVRREDDALRFSGLIFRVCIRCTLPERTIRDGGQVADKDNRGCTGLFPIVMDGESVLRGISTLRAVKAARFSRFTPLSTGDAAMALRRC